MVKKIRSKESKVVFSKVGEISDLVVQGIGDTSFKSDDKSIGGNLILLGNKNSKDVVPLYWKSKSIQQVCHSAKDAETRNLVKLVDDSKYLANQIEQLLFGREDGNIEVKLYTDSLPTLESIASTKQVERKLLRNSIADLKSKLEDRSIKSYSWLDTKDMIADILTKESKDDEDILDVVQENRFRMGNSEDNFVTFQNGEIRLTNNTIKKK